MKQIPKHQQGAVLVIGLVLLMAMTLLALAGSANTLITTRLANNIASKEASLQTADTLLSIMLKSCTQQAITQTPTPIDCSNLTEIQNFANSLPTGSSITTTLSATTTVPIHQSLAMSNITTYRFEAHASATINGSTTRLTMGSIMNL